MENFKTLEEKIVYVHYNGAIRQMKLHQVTCHYEEFGNKFHITWLIAGVDEPTPNRPNDMYYSVEDAMEEKNQIEYVRATTEDVNNCVKDFFIDNKGCIHYFGWAGSRAEEKKLWCYDFYLEYVDKTFVIKSKNGQIIPTEMYRTREECMAHHRAEVITF